MNQTRWSSFGAGLRDTMPMMVGAAPFALIYGTLVTASPLALWQGQLMSLLVFAGSAQFIAIGLIAGHAGLLAIWATTFIVNLRHMLYAANLLPHVAHLPLRWRLVLGALTTDETFGIMVGHYARSPRDPLGHWYYLGSGLPMYINWQCWTLLGLAFGATFPELKSYGLDFALVATFIAVVVPLLVNLPQLAAALSAGALAWLLRDLLAPVGLLAAILGGVGIGLLLSRHRPKRSAAGRRR